MHAALKRKINMVTRYKKRNLIIWSTLLFIVIFYLGIKLKAEKESIDSFLEQEEGVDEKDEIVDHLIMSEDFYGARNHINTSVLGSILFKNAKIPERRSKTYKILIWRIGPFLESRHYYSFTSTRKDPFAQCSVNNCVVSYEDGELAGADAVVIHLHGLAGAGALPRAPRRPDQRWIFLTDESPVYSFYYPEGRNLTQYAGVFNWSMSYRLESDVPVPYGRALPLQRPTILDPAMGHDAKFAALVPHAAAKRRDVLVAAMVTHCKAGNDRLRYIHDLQRHMTVHLYGGCGTEFNHICPQKGEGNNSLYGGLCPEMNRYLFYLAFENSNCKQYFSEKAFWNGLRIGAVPVLLGPTTEDCRLLLPPDSYLNVRDFPTPRELAQHLLEVNATWGDAYLKHHYWRNNFESRNEHGYFGAPSFHYCRVCEALNYNSEEPKIYNDLSELLDIQQNCFGYEWNLNN